MLLLFCLTLLVISVLTIMTFLLLRNPQHDDDECSRCLDVLEEPLTQLPCGHLFHRDCAEEWRGYGQLDAHRQCPMCRAPDNLI